MGFPILVRWHLYTKPTPVVYQSPPLPVQCMNVGNSTLYAAWLKNSSHSVPRSDGKAAGCAGCTLHMQWLTSASRWQAAVAKAWLAGVVRSEVGSAHRLWNSHRGMQDWHIGSKTSQETLTDGHVPLLTHWGLDKMAANVQTFLGAFS